MKLAVLGLSLSSSWGNGHATTYRALLKAFAARGHEVLFLERDAPWYAAHRDCPQPDWCELRLYASLEELKALAGEISSADAVIVGSFVPDGVAVGSFAQAHASGPCCFYDIDTPVTLSMLLRGEDDYLSAELIAGYDVYFSFTGGPTLRRLEDEFGARRARALYCCVDTELYHPVRAPVRWDMSYLGTYSEDRQPALERLLIDVARRRPEWSFAVAGAQYPAGIDWPANVERIEHLPPGRHADFYSASRCTLNLTRADMRAAGWSPSVRLFEAGACAAPIVSDRWKGIESFFAPNREIRLVDDAEGVEHALAGDLRHLGVAAQARVQSEHSAGRRAAQLEADLVHAAGARGRPTMENFANV